MTPIFGSLHIIEPQIVWLCLIWMGLDLLEQRAPLLRALGN